VSHPPSRRPEAASLERAAAAARGPSPSTRALLGILIAVGVPSLATPCDSTGCLLVTRSASGLLAPKAWRFDLSFRATDDSQLLSGSGETSRVNRPKVDFENQIVRPGFHQDLGGSSRFLQLDIGYGLTGRTTALASAPVVTHRDYEIGHPAALTESYETWGLGDTLVGVRHSFLAPGSLSVVGGIAVELPTGDHRLVSPEALFDIGVLDPMLQPGSGSFDVVLSAQCAKRLAVGDLDLTAAFSYQANTTNDLDYRYGNDAIASLSLARPLASWLRGSLQVKYANRGRSQYRGEGVEATGGTIVYAVPGLSVPLPTRFSVYLFVPLPVYRYVNETQVAPRISLVAGLSRMF
jgi:hypothetical protein